MGPLEDMGPYVGTIITTRKTDVQSGADNPPGFCDVLIGLLLLPVGLSAGAFIGLFLWEYIGLICVIGLGVLGFWACAYYGTDHSLFGHRKTEKLSDDDRAVLQRRLSDKPVGGQ